MIIISQQRMAATSNGVISSVFQRPTTITIVSYLWGLRRILGLTILREIAHYDTDILEWCSRKIRVTVSTRLSWIFSPCTVLQISQTPFPYNFLIKYIPISLSASGQKWMMACPLLTYEEQSEHKEITIVVTSFLFLTLSITCKGFNSSKSPVRWDWLVSLFLSCFCLYFILTYFVTKRSM